MLFKIDTSILDKFNGIIVAVIVIAMIISLISFKKNTKDSLTTLLICALLLWIINDVNDFLATVTQIFTFIGGVFSA